jgi:hypothetical protein
VRSFDLALGSLKETLGNVPRGRSGTGPTDILSLSGEGNAFGENVIPNVKNLAVFGVATGAPGVFGTPGVFGPSVMRVIIRLNCVFLGLALLGCFAAITLSNASSLKAFSFF